MLRRVAAIHTATREIHDRRRAVDRSQPAGGRFAVPMQLPNLRAFAMSATAESHDLVTFREQRLRERLSEKSAATGEDDARFHIRASGNRHAPLSQVRRAAISR